MNEEVQNNQNQNNKKSKKKIIIICTIIFIALLIGGLTIFFLTREPKETRELIKKVNQINANFVDKNLSNDGMYTVGNGQNQRTCYKYAGNNQEEVLNMIMDTYLIFAREDSMFNIVKDSENNQMLYVCLPKNCKYKEIRKYKTVYDEIEKTNKVTINGKKTYYIHDTNGKKQFLVPVDMC